MTFYKMVFTFFIFISFSYAETGIKKTITDIITPKQQIILKANIEEAIVYLDDKAIAMTDSLKTANFSASKGEHKISIRKESEDKKYSFYGSKNIFSSGEGSMTIKIKATKSYTTNYQKEIKEQEEQQIAIRESQKKEDTLILKATKEINGLRENLEIEYEKYMKAVQYGNALNVLRSIDVNSGCESYHSSYYFVGTKMQEYNKFKDDFSAHLRSILYPLMDIIKKAKYRYQDAFFEVMKSFKKHSSLIENGKINPGDIVNIPNNRYSLAIIPKSLHFHFKVKKDYDQNFSSSTVLGDKLVNSYPGFKAGTNKDCKTIVNYNMGWVKQAMELRSNLSSFVRLN